MKDISEKLSIALDHVEKIHNRKDLKKVILHLPKYDIPTLIESLPYSTILTMLPSILGGDEAASVDLFKKVFSFSRFYLLRFCLKELEKADEASASVIIWVLSIQELGKKLNKKELIKIGIGNKSIAKSIIGNPHMLFKLKDNIGELGMEKVSIAKHLFKHHLPSLSKSCLYNLCLRHEEIQERALNSSLALEKLGAELVDVLKEKKINLNNLKIVQLKEALNQAIPITDCKKNLLISHK